MPVADAPPVEVVDVLLPFVCQLQLPPQPPTAVVVPGLLAAVEVGDLPIAEERVVAALLQVRTAGAPQWNGGGLPALVVEGREMPEEMRDARLGQRPLPPGVHKGAFGALP
ncbi:MAG: hypothetical protein R3F59_30325 [Myxococcota bacterium]